jgi:hypothetical protein
MRFSLISLLVFTALIAAVCGIFALPDVFSHVMLALLTVAIIPTASISGIVFGRGKAKAFSIGVLVSIAWIGPVAMIFGVFGGSISFTDADIEESLIWKIIFAVIYLTSALCGGIAIGIRWLCLRGAGVTSAANSNSSPTMVIIDPRDKAELYAILQGQMANRFEVETNGLHSPVSVVRNDAAQR